MLFYTRLPNAGIVVSSDSPPLPDGPNDHPSSHIVTAEMGDRSVDDIASILPTNPVQEGTTNDLFREYVDLTRVTMPDGGWSHGELHSIDSRSLAEAGSLFLECFLVMTYLRI